MRRTWREGSFTGDPDRYVKALEWASVSIGTPLLGNMKGRYFLRAFEKKGYVKMPCKRVSPHRGPVGAPGGDSLAGTFWREKDSISGFFSWTRRTLRFYVWGPSGTLLKGQGSPELRSAYGAQRGCL
jgi:hypothetical protein